MPTLNDVMLLLPPGTATQENVALINQLIDSLPGANAEQIASVVKQRIAQQMQATLQGLGLAPQNNQQSELGAAIAKLLEGKVGGNVPRPPSRSDVFSRGQLQGFGVPEDFLQQALLGQFGVTSPNSPEAQVAAANAQTNAAQQRAQQAYWEGLLAMQQGQQDLAQRQFEAGDFWNGIASQYAGINAGTNLAQTETQGIGTRGGLDISAGGIYGGLVNTLGDLADKQARLGLDILTTPRNAVAGFLMGLGATPETAGQFSQFDVRNLLGIDPGQIQGLVDSATKAAQAAQTKAAAPQQVPIGDLVARLGAAANATAKGTPVKTGSTTQQSAGQPASGAQQKPENFPNPFTPGSPEWIYLETLKGYHPAPETINPAGSIPTVPEEIAFTRPPQGQITYTPGTNPIFDAVMARPDSLPVSQGRGLILPQGLSAEDIFPAQTYQPVKSNKGLEGFGLNPPDIGVFGDIAGGLAGLLDKLFAPGNPVGLSQPQLGEPGYAFNQ